MRKEPLEPQAAKLAISPMAHKLRKPKQVLARAVMDSALGVGVNVLMAPPALKNE